MGKSIALIQFSSRSSGNCSRITTYIRDYYNNDSISFYTINTETLPACGSCDYECLKRGMTCPNMTESQQEMFDSICAADMVYFIVPNYCGFPCANYYAFNERSVGYFSMDRAKREKYAAIKKRFIIVSNTENENFLNAMKQHTAIPDVVYLKTSKYGKRSTDGDILDSEDAKKDLKAFLEADNL